MDKSIWIISCLIIFLPWSRVHPLPQFHLEQQHHIDQLLETWGCYLMPQLWHDMLELFDMVIYSAIHIDWSILHSLPPTPPHPTPKKNYPKPSPTITFRILNVNLTLVIIIFSLPMCSNPWRKLCNHFIKGISKLCIAKRNLWLSNNVEVLGAIKPRS